ncbi:MAG: hypothetical protein GY842_05965 [bacterium]|nr:hypothetical protein [bacterium]
MYRHGMIPNNRKVGNVNRTTMVRRSGTVLLLIAVCLWLGSGALSTAHSEDETAPAEVRASRFVVVDDEGKKRAEFGVLEDGEAKMVVWNQTRSTAVTVGMGRTGMPRITLENSKAEALLDLGILDDQYPVFVMRDANGRRRLGAMVPADGTTAIGLYDTKKGNRCTVSVGQDGDPSITLKDSRGKIRAGLMVASDGTCALDLFDAKGQERIVFQTDSQGEADAAIFGADGKAVWSATDR